MKEVTIYTIQEDKVVTTSDYVDLMYSPLSDVSFVELGDTPHAIKTVELERLKIERIRRFDKVKGDSDQYIAVSKEVKELLGLEQKGNLIKIEMLELQLRTARGEHRELTTNMDNIANMTVYERLLFLFKGWRYIIFKLKHP